MQCDAFNRLFPNHILVDTHTRSEFQGVGSLRPDLCLYRKNVLDQVIIKDQFIANFGLADIIIEVKKDAGSDPFIDFKSSDASGQIFIRNTKSNLDDINSVLGQIAAYAAAMCARQYRTHCFTISIFGELARVIRWDRSGATVSRAFNYHDESQWLAEFARLYSTASYAQQGYDMTVTKASAEEEGHFVDVVAAHVKEQLNLSDDEGMKKYMGVHYEEGKVFKVEVWPQKRVKTDEPDGNGEPEEDADAADACSIPQTPEQNTTSIGDGSAEGSIHNEATSAAIHDSDDNPFLEKLGYNSDTDSEPMSDSIREATPSEGANEEAAKSEPKKRSISENYTGVQYFLVSKPVAAPISMSGRSTRGYWAVKLPDEGIGETEYTIAFLKDTWRTSIPGSEKEGDIMVELIEDGVSNVSDIFCHGDLTECDNTDSGERKL